MTKRRREERERKRERERADQRGFSRSLLERRRGGRNSEKRGSGRRMRRRKGRMRRRRNEGAGRHLYKDLHGQWEWNAGTASLVFPASLQPPPPLLLSFLVSFPLFLPVSNQRRFFLLSRSFSASLWTSTDRDVAHRIITACFSLSSLSLSLSREPAPLFTTALLCAPVELLLRRCYTTIITTAPPRIYC